MVSSLVWPCAALPDAELAERTTMRVGGRVEWLLEPANPAELAGAYSAARERGYLPRILGGGANLVIEDGFLRGVAITTSRMRYVFRPGAAEDPAGEWTTGERVAAPTADERDEPRLVAWAGASMPGLVRAASELGWTGLEGLAGVPGHLGGGVAMNAGGRHGEMWNVVESVRVVDASGSLRDLSRAECAPRYRDGNLGAAIVAGAVLRLSRSTPREVKERAAEFLRHKRAVQPVTEWSAGCIFKNPDRERSSGRSAGLLVEQCGGKSLARGGAIVSPLHGNFIVNTGSATAADVLALIEDVRDLVAQKSGIRLETEVKIWRGEE
jgi:UDP-N-acetylmuramate dehydrogenase